MLLKVIVYAYLTSIYSSRKIEKALQQNIHFMWLSAGTRLDHNTINRFRSDRLQEVLKGIFSRNVLHLPGQGLPSLKQVYMDGTKLESAANRYTFVWGKSIKASKERICPQLNELWQYAWQMAAEEMKDTAPLEFGQIEPGKVQETIEQIDQALKDRKADKKVKQKLSYARRHWPSKPQDYQQQAQVEEYVKYNYFRSEQRKKVKQGPFHRNNLHYNSEKDCYYCPMGQAMRKVEEAVRKTSTGYEQRHSRYQAANCHGCPLRGLCHQGKGDRTGCWR